MPTPEPIDSPVTPTGRRGLLAVATSPVTLPRWLDGVAFQAESCVAPLPVPWVPCTTPDPWEDGENRPTPDSFRPIMLRGFDRCSTLDGLPAPQRELMARQNLTVTASWQAEREFSAGVASTLAGDPNPFLSNGDAQAATDAAEAPNVALALLEGTLATCLHGARGMIHVPPTVATLLDGFSLLHAEGGLLLTANDNVVVIGSGYLGDDPDGDAPAVGSMWIYGTALTYQQRGELTPEGQASERVDRARNTVETWVTQPLLLWRSTCCTVAAQVDITGP